MEQKIRKRQSHDFIQRTFVVSKTTNRRFDEVKRNKKNLENKQFKSKKVGNLNFYFFFLLKYFQNIKLLCLLWFKKIKFTH